MIDRSSVRVRRCAYVLGSSIAAIAAASASPAAAQCTPDPTIANGTTNCAGLDGDGLSVTTANTKVAIASGAIVQSGAAGAITVRASNVTISVNGLVDGGGKAGIVALGQSTIMVPCDPYAGASVSYCRPGELVPSNPITSVAVNVAEGATVTGAQAVLLSRNAGLTSSPISISVVNAGTMTGTAGPALVNDAASPGSLTVTNQATGRIKGMTGFIDSVNNQGTIDGLANSAIATTAPSAFVINAGQIVSNGAAATLSATGALNVTNDAGATLGGSGVAITAGGALTLTNAGTVNGSVISTAPVGRNSVIDTRNGVINGDLILGAGDDKLLASLDIATAQVSSITGTIDGGAGIDTISIGTIIADATIGSAALPTNFELLGFELGNNATVTLAPTLSSGLGIAVSGSGTLISQADLVSSGPAVAGQSYGSLTFINQANITSTLTGSGQTAAGGVTYLTNTGTITASGGAGASAMYNLTNNGTITASGTAAAASFGVLINSGAIRSTNETGASVFGNYSYAASTNSGTIEGATTGLELSYGSFTNTGTITGGVTGVALGYSGTLINAAGGTVTGGTYGVLNTSSSARVVNAGTINGSVNLAPQQTYDFSNDVFVDAGGTVNGAILLGGGDDQLVVSIDAAADRPFAGATGGVDAGSGYDTLRYLVNADASAALALPNGFEALAYELDNNASLTLIGQAPIATTIGLTGNGTVTLNGTISATNRTLVDASIQTLGQLAYGVAGTAKDLTIVNNGALSLTKNDPYSYSMTSAVNASTADFTNNGSIALTSAAGSYYPAYAVFGGATVTNAGSITLTGGGIGITGAQSVINTGTITDTDAQNARGVGSFTSLNNSGTIRTDGNAVEAGYSATLITNSGTIESLRGSGVLLNGYGLTLINEKSGTIKGATAVDISSGGTIINRGAIVGNVSGSSYSYGSTTYIADGGTIAGDLTFGSGSDSFIMTGTTTGVSGAINGGEGNDLFGYGLTETATVSLDVGKQLVGFEDAMMQVAGADVVATVTSTDAFEGNLYVSGEGKVVNTASIGGNVFTQTRYLGGAIPLTDLTKLAAFENQGTIAGSVQGTIGSFTNSGTILGDPDSYYSSVSIQTVDDLTVANSGTISAGVELGVSGKLAMTNSGTISTTGYNSLAINLTNSDFSGSGLPKGEFVNSGTVTSTRSDSIDGYFKTGLSIIDYGAGAFTVTNTATGTISAEGSSDIGVLSYYAALTIDNAGTIRAGTAANRDFSSAAVRAIGDATVTIRNSGTIDGAVRTDAGDDRIENSGTITGLVDLGNGNDIFVQRANASLGGLVDGGDGTDRFVVDAAGADGALSSSQLTSFEQLAQTGTGTVDYSGTFEADTIELQGGTLAVSAGDTLGTAGAVTVTGGDAGVNVRNLGSIAGLVQFGAGNDSYTEGAGSTVGGVDGGEGVDVYGVVLAGDRKGIGARTGFEALAVEGSGTLTLALDQDYQAITLTGTNLTAALGAFAIGQIQGSAGSENVTLDGDASAVSLGSGDDGLSLTASTLRGTYEGGAGNDVLKVVSDGAVTLTGSVTGFETIALGGHDLTVAGTLGAGGETLALDGDTQSLTLADGGAIAGTVILGGGDNTFRLLAGGSLQGAIEGGAGFDTAVLDAPDAVNVWSALTGFERLQSSGSGALSFAGGASQIEEMSANGDVAIGANALLATRQLTFGAADNRLVIAGGFSGSVAGGAGNDAIEISGGTAASPVAFGTISDVESLRMSAGLATISGGGTFGTVSLTGGRLIGLAGSTITASTIDVATGATFGSAGTVNGNVVVNGILSPGASPGTMTVNGNMTLAGGSTSIFEITPTVSDKLIVNGNLTISQGAALQITADQAVKPGQSLNLIYASEGIDGSFTTVVKPAYLFGFIVQDGDTISLLGQFRNDASFTPQVSGAIDYVNGVLVSGAASTALVAAAPGLVTASGETDQAAFARLTPEAYASAGQLAVEQGLELASTARSEGFAVHRDVPGFFTFGSTLASTRKLDGSDSGASRTKLNGYGFLGGVGWGSTDWSVGGFVGYLEGKQTLSSLAARTEVDSFVAGIHGRWTDGSIGIKATVAYNGGDATTRRALPGSGTAEGGYDLKGWTGDFSVDYAMALSRNWSVRPSLGVTAIRTRRDGVTENGGSAYALAVASERDNAVFIDGAVTLKGGESGQAVVRPYLSLGARYQADGRTPYALAAMGGGGYGLEAIGATRAPVLATAALGADFAVTSRLTLFGALSGEAGDADRRASVRAGLHLDF